jgi:hypothetical protein
MDITPVFEQGFVTTKKYFIVVIKFCIHGEY